MFDGFAGWDPDFRYKAALKCFAVNVSYEKGGNPPITGQAYQSGVNTT